MLTKTTDTAFQSDVLMASGLTMVVFSATWCQPCKDYEPKIVALIESGAITAKVVKLDVDQSPQTTAKYGIKMMPTTVLFKGGTPVATHAGRMADAKLTDWISEHA